MKVIAPFEITGTILHSSTVPENDYAEWAAGTAYSVGQKVIRLTTHKIYEALASTTGDTPETSPTKWLDLGATNRWKMFDQKVGTRTSATSTITVEFTVGQVVPAVALLELDAREVTVTVTDAVDGIVYSRTQELQGLLVASDWWHYFFDPFVRRSSVIFNDLPSYRNATVKVEIVGGALETVECGVCIIGQVYQFAEAVRYGARAGIQDYSRKETDDWGNYEVVERAFAKRANWNLLISNTDVDLYQTTLASLRATPAVYIGGDNYDATFVYGFYKDFDIVISYPKFAECSIELEGLI